MPLSSPDKGKHYLSPDIFSLAKNAENSSNDNVLPLKHIFGSKTKGDRRSLINLFTKISGAEKKMKEIRRQSLSMENSMPDQLKFQNVENQLNQHFHQLYKSIRPHQIHDLTNHGYTYMTPKQLEKFYGPNSMVGPAPFNATELINMDDLDREAALLSLYSSIGSSQLRRNRSKRAPIVLGSSVLMPIIGSPSVLSPLVLHPLVLSPLILSPSVLGKFNLILDEYFRLQTKILKQVH